MGELPIPCEVWCGGRSVQRLHSVHYTLVCKTAKPYMVFSMVYPEIPPVIDERPRNTDELLAFCKLHPSWKIRVQSDLKRAQRYIVHSAQTVEEIEAEFESDDVEFWDVLRGMPLLHSITLSSRVGSNGFIPLPSHPLQNIFEIDVVVGKFARHDNWEWLHLFPNLRVFTENMYSLDPIAIQPPPSLLWHVGVSFSELRSNVDPCIMQHYVTNACNGRMLQLPPLPALRMWASDLRVLPYPPWAPIAWGVSSFEMMWAPVRIDINVLIQNVETMSNLRFLWIKGSHLDEEGLGRLIRSKVARRLYYIFVGDDSFRENQIWIHGDTWFRRVPNTWNSHVFFDLLKYVDTWEKGMFVGLSVVGEGEWGDWFNLP